MTPNEHGADGAQGAARYTVGPMNPNIGSIMHARLFDSDSLTQRLKDRQVAQAVVNGSQQLTIQFSDGTTLIVEARSDGLLTHVESAGKSATQDTSQHPTQRQLEYLVFISKCIHRFGRAPAERDIERHFLVSAPTVNQMMQMLERRGFITRQPWCAAIHSNLHRPHPVGQWPCFTNFYSKI